MLLITQEFIASTNFDLDAKLYYRVTESCFPTELMLKAER